MTNLVVNRKGFAQVMEEWLIAIGVKDDDNLEIVFLPQEVIVRPASPAHAELDEWLAQFKQKHDNVMRRLADS